MADFQPVRKGGRSSNNASSTSSSHSNKYASQYQQLTEMGFDGKRVQKVLESTHGDLEKATAILLGEEDGHEIAADDDHDFKPTKKSSSSTASHMPSNNSKEMTEQHRKMMSTYKVTKCKEINNLSHDRKMCTYWHTYSDRRRNPFQYNYSCYECPNVIGGAECKIGDKCLHAHNMLERMFHPELFKISMCQRQQDGKKCDRSAICAFAHSDADLRVSPSKLDPSLINNPPAKPVITDLVIPDNIKENVLTLIKEAGSEGVYSLDLYKKYSHRFHEALDFSEDRYSAKLKLKEFLEAHEEIELVYSRGNQPVYVFKDPNAPKIEETVAEDDSESNNNSSESKPLTAALKTVGDRLADLIKNSGSEGILGSDIPKKYLDAYNERLDATDEHGNKIKLKELLAGYAGISLRTNKLQPRYFYDEKVANANAAPAVDSKPAKASYSAVASYAEKAKQAAAASAAAATAAAATKAPAAPKKEAAPVAPAPAPTPAEAASTTTTTASTTSSEAAPVPGPAPTTAKVVVPPSGKSYAAIAAAAKKAAAPAPAPVEPVKEVEPEPVKEVEPEVVQEEAAPVAEVVSEPEPVVAEPEPVVVPEPAAPEPEPVVVAAPEPLVTKAPIVESSSSAPSSNDPVFQFTMDKKTDTFAVDLSTTTLPVTSNNDLNDIFSNMKAPTFGTYNMPSTPDREFKRQETLLPPGLSKPVSKPAEKADDEFARKFIQAQSLASSLQEQLNALQQELNSRKSEIETQSAQIKTLQTKLAEAESKPSGSDEQLKAQLKQKEDEVAQMSLINHRYDEEIRRIQQERLTELHHFFSLFQQMEGVLINCKTDMPAEKATPEEVRTILNFIANLRTYTTGAKGQAKYKYDIVQRQASSMVPYMFEPYSLASGGRYSAMNPYGGVAINPYDQSSYFAQSGILGATDPNRSFMGNYGQNYNVGQCAMPGCRQPGVYKCTRCMNVTYCTLEHQQSHWATHVSSCSNI